MSRRLNGLLFFAISAWIYTSSADSAGINLLERYPTALTGEDSQNGREWSFAESDLYSLSHFLLESGDRFRVEIGQSLLGVGASKDGAVWAVIIPKEAGTLKSEATAEPEAIAHVWLRFHPKTISELFPPDAVTANNESNALVRIRQIANWKFPASWHAGPLALIPPPGVFTVDIDTAQKSRRFFSLDRSDQSVKYYPTFSKAVPTREITREEAEASFDQLWSEYDQGYAMFVIRPEVDWNALREEFRPKAQQCKTAFEFGSVCAEMLSKLRDLHIWIRLGDESIPVFNRPRPGNANPKAVASILGGLKKAGQRVEWTITEDRIGYIAVYGWSDMEIPRQVDQILESMPNTRGIIFDVRLNGGGDEPSAEKVAERFIDQEAIYSYSQYRNGPKHTDLTEKFPRRFGPSGPWRYDRPVILLIGQRCLSSNESFIAMMDQCPQVATMGDKTGGSSGNPKLIELPIGVTISMPRWLDLLADGKPLDERGVQPDIPIATTDQSFAGDDPVLKAALDRMRKEPLPENPIAVPTKEPAPLESVADNPKKESPSSAKSSVPSPNVVMVDPLFGATDVSPQTEILITFDSPMKSDPISLYWPTGGFHAIGEIEYLKDIFQFIIPIELEPNTTHKISAPAGGFQSEKGGLSAKMEWNFQTGVSASDEQAPIPNLVSVEPATGAEIPRVALLRLQFDAPMYSHSASIRDASKSEKASAALCPWMNYDEDNQILTIPVFFPPQWQGAIQLTGLLSQAGKRANPILLEYKTGGALFDEIQTKQFQQSRESQEVKSLLTSMQQARKNLRSFRESVQQQIASIRNTQGYTYLTIQSATVCVQGGSQFVADISNCMSVPFYFGNTGNRYWRYSKEKGKEYLFGLLPNEINKTEIHLADPFLLTTADVETVLKSNNLEYAGTQDLPDRTAHVLRAWRILPGNKGERLCVDEYWIDAQTYLPVRLQRTSSEGNQIVYRFQFDAINKEFSSSDFAPAKLTQSPVELEEPLGEGFDTRFFFLEDGSNGDFRAEWGKSGAKSYSSVGVN